MLPGKQPGRFNLKNSLTILFCILYLLKSRLYFAISSSALKSAYFSLNQRSGLRFLLALFIVSTLYHIWPGLSSIIFCFVDKNIVLYNKTMLDRPNKELWVLFYFLFRVISRVLHTIFC